MSDQPGVRLDRWLWAARFFKTRAQAKSAIEGGKIAFHLSSDAQGQTQKPKVSKVIGLGDMLTIGRGWRQETVIVRKLTEQRGNATIARTLFEETVDSIELRESETARRRMEKAGLRVPARKPTKRDRRELQRLKSQDIP